MSRPATLDEIRNLAAALNDLGISTVEDLRLCIHKDVNNSTRWISETTMKSHSLLVSLLMAEFSDDAASRSKKKLGKYWRGLKTFPNELKYSRNELRRLWREKQFKGIPESRRQLWALTGQMMIRHRRLWSNWRKHWADVIVLIVAPLLMLGLALRAQCINNRDTQFVIVKSTTIPAFEKLGDKLEMANVPYQKGAFTSIDQLRERYTIVNLSAGSTLREDQLLSAALSSKMSSRRILSLSIKSGNYPAGMAVPSEAVMVFSPRNVQSTQPTADYVEIVLLRLNKNAELTSALVAIKQDELDKVAKLLGAYDVFLAEIKR
jgi:hypothetical protein